MTTGIYLNGRPLNLDEVLDIDIYRESFTFHFIHKPQTGHNHSRSSVRTGRVRTISKEDYLAQKGGCTAKQQVSQKR